MLKLKYFTKDDIQQQHAWMNWHYTDKRPYPHTAARFTVDIKLDNRWYKSGLSETMRNQEEVMYSAEYAELVDKLIEQANQQLYKAFNLIRNQIEVEND